jgi:hypothetical protein
MQIKYELTQTDFTEAYTVHRNSRWLSKWARRLFIWIAGLGTAIIILGFLVRPSWEQAKALVPFLVLVTIWIAVLWFLPRRMMRRQFLKQPGAHGLRTLTLDDTGAHWRWNGGSSDVEWKNYIRSAEGKNQILFYTSPACFNILPKRAIEGDRLSELRTLLHQNIKSDRR